MKQTIFILWLILFSTAVLFAQDNTLRGDEAIKQLKETGQYDSLMEAVKQSRKQNGQTDEPQSEDAIGQMTRLTASDGAASDQFGTSVAISGDTAIVGAYTDNVGANNDQGSAYVFTRSAGVWTQQQQLTASDGAGADAFGISVAISGNTAIVGSYIDDVGANSSQGSAYVFTRSAGVWTQQQKLTASGGAAFDRFGFSVAISGDTVIVGAYLDDVGANGDQGSAYVFTRSAGVWSQQQQLTASDGAVDDNFGSSVAISGDTAVVGAYLDDVGANSNQGSAYVFTRSGVTWTQQAQLTASDGAASDTFGWRVSISGNTAIVGSYGDDVGANANQGSAYVFTRSGVTWTEQPQLTASDGAASDRFGFSVAIDGNTAIVGADFDDVGANSNQGSAYVYRVLGTNWTQEAQRVAPAGETFDEFGTSVAISGNTAIVGANRDTVSGNNAQGSAYIFVRSGTTWTQQAQLNASDGATNDFFGYSVSISGDTAVVGAYFDDVGATADQGSAYVFVRNGTTWTQQAQLTAADGATNDFFGYSISISGETVVVGSYWDDVGANTNQGSAYVFVRSGTTWTQQQQLIASDGAASDFFGYSIAISENTAIVGAYRDDVGANTDQGSAYVFVRNGTVWTQQAQLNASDGAAFDNFGNSVSISNNTAIVGANQDDVGANTNQGSAYVFVRNGITWTQQQKLTASDGAAGDSFGISVSISGDAAVVGAYFDDIGANTSQGSAYVFVRSGTTWTQQQQLTAIGGATNDNFGNSVAIGGDKIVVGALGADVSVNIPLAPNAVNQGAAYFFINNLAPTSSNISIGGRILAANGIGVRNAIVQLTLGDGETRTTRTGSFGYYRFDDINVGQTVVLSIISKRFTFAPQVVSVTEELSELDIIALE